MLQEGMFETAELTLASTILTKLKLTLLRSPTAVVLALFIISGLVCCLIGGYLQWQMQGQHSQTVKMIAQAAADYQHQQAETQPTQIQVYVAGAVIHSGVYLLEEGERVGQLIELAGGFSEDASQQFVTQQLNLAQTLIDGEQIYVPTADEQLAQSVNLASQPNPTADNSLISINSATAPQLESLTGIGTKRAKDIVSGRPYAQISDLVTNQILTQSVFDEIEDQITL